jgi:predicted CopG family antitoxin
MYRQIAVKQDVYERLVRLKHELGLSTMSDVVDTLIKAYEGYSLAKKLRLIFQLLDDVKQLSAMIEDVQSNMKPPAKSYEKEQKSAQKGELTSYMRR